MAYRGHWASGQQASGTGRTSSLTSAVTPGRVVVADAVEAPAEFVAASSTAEFGDGRAVGVSCFTPGSARNSVVETGGVFMTTVGTPAIGDPVFVNVDGIPQATSAGGAVQLANAVFRSAPTSEGTCLVLLT